MHKTAHQRAREQDETQKAWQQHPGGIQGKCLHCGKRAEEYPFMLVLHHDPPKGTGGTTNVYLASLGAAYRLVPLRPECHESQEVVNGLREDRILPRSKWRE